jgi:hypothetical protein
MKPQLPESSSYDTLYALSGRGQEGLGSGPEKTPDAQAERRRTEKQKIVFISLVIGLG